MVAGGNLMIFSNMLGKLADHEVSVSIPVKAYDLSYLTVNESHVILIGILTIALMPLICLIAGFAIWFYRRKK